MKHCTPLLSTALCLLLLSGAAVLAQSTKSVLASGAVSASQGESVLLGTVGQSFIGYTGTSASVAALGFWTPVTMKLSSVDPFAASTIILSGKPNPVRKSATLSFEIPERAQASLVLYNALGQPVETLVDGILESGAVNVQVEMEGLPSGSYTALLRIGAEQVTTTLLLVD